MQIFSSFSFCKNFIIRQYTFINPPLRDINRIRENVSNFINMQEK